MMTQAEIDKIASEFAAACTGFDAKRMTRAEFDRKWDAAFGGRSQRESIAIHLAVARLQGRDLTVTGSEGEIIGASSDLAEALTRRVMKTQHS
jgi:hypothetical protein